MHTEYDKETLNSTLLQHFILRPYYEEYGELVQQPSVKLINVKKTNHN